MKQALLLSLLLPLSFTACNRSPSDHTPAYAAGFSSDGFSLLNPFEFRIDPMERLLLVNIENDPDTVYMGFEPQVFDDPVNGRGMLVIGWRVDGRVDVYHQAGLRLDAEKYDIAGKGLAHMVVRDLEGSFFHVDEKGVQALVEFDDLLGRPVHISIRERNDRRRRPFGLLAPMGDAAENPSAMPLVLLHDFYFVRQKHTDISVRLNGREHQPDKLPMPMDRSRMYFTRYSPDPFIVTLNPAIDGQLAPLRIEPGKQEIRLPDDAGSSAAGRLELAWVGGVPAIARLKHGDGRHEIALAFDPPFPNLEALADGASVSGKFVIKAHPTTGRITGDYLVMKNGQRLHLELVPSGGWIPNERKLSVRIIYRVAGIFRTWPKTYRWTAAIEKGEGAGAFMQSRWERIR